MYTPFQGNHAYRWLMRGTDGHQEIDHRGGIHGIQTSILPYPDDKLLMVVLWNVVPSRVDPMSCKLGGRITLGGKMAAK
jgi:hypothetical protein